MNKEGRPSNESVAVPCHLQAKQEEQREEKMTNPKDVRKKAPDGGWGWFVCLGSSLISLSLRSLDPSFGLLFHDLLIEFNVDSTGTSIIMSILDSIVNFSGFLVGPLLKKYSYRKVAFFGSLLSCTGLILTSRANSMLFIICTYSILGGLGTGLALASSFVALNTFFDKKRGQAVGFSMAGTTLAMMLVPQFVHLLLNLYGFRGAMLIIGGGALHSIVGACLLRPLDVQDTVTVQKKQEKPTETDLLLQKYNNDVKREITNGTQNEKNEKTSKVEKEPRNSSYINKLKEFFDLDLLRDGVYLNVIFGCSLYYVAESNFKLMTPFFLAHIGMTKLEIASCLSITAFTDIIARLLLPTIFDRLKFKKRFIVWSFCLLVGIGRSFLAEQSKGTLLVVTFVVIGFLRGATLVNLNLSISECCSLKKLPSALGMFMVSKGICVVIMSPLLGYIRDITESYTICIHVMTLLICITFLAWGFEFMLAGFRKRKSLSSEEVQNVADS
ncbi:monocarboxylate transporter 12-like [Calliopsis andreniformis]|uniref:monocarboxylate transporter 12-like n=1 Tax=Calliopsis andreniformis TaxID=337506 RepID=UPI003FCE7ACD